jgi:putative FmdB family regulatory protein
MPRCYTEAVPVYEYACMDCKKVVSVLVRRVGASASPACPECGGRHLTRLISRFAFHLSMMSKLEQLDPKYDKMIDAASPDLSFDNLVKKYKLDQPLKKREKD